MKQSKILFKDIKGMLSRDEMKTIKGGDDLCTVTNTQSNGSDTSYKIAFGSGWTCSGMSSYAASFANSVQISSGGSTHYDCGCDGWGK
jgi:hypothetical protein